jgi:hypothetical protein
LRKKKNAELRGDGTHPMDVDIPGTSIEGIDTNTTGNGLGVGLWEPFQ